MFKLDLERQRIQRSNWQHLSDHRKIKRIPEKLFCLIDNAKDFECVDHNKLWEILQEMGIPDHVSCLLQNLYIAKKQQLEPDMEQWTGSKLGKE